MVKILLADDHALVRNGILRILAHDPRIQVLGEACDFSEAIAKAHKFRPDVLILDLNMPVKRGLSNNDLSRELKSCGAKVLGMSFANDEDAKFLAQSFGAVELLDKITLAEKLIPMIMRLAFASDYPPPNVPPKQSNTSELQ